MLVDVAAENRAIAQIILDRYTNWKWRGTHTDKVTTFIARLCGGSLEVIVRQRRPAGADTGRGFNDLFDPSKHRHEHCLQIVDHEGRWGRRVIVNYTLSGRASETVLQSLYDKLMTFATFPTGKQAPQASLADTLQGLKDLLQDPTTT